MAKHMAEQTAGETSPPTQRFGAAANLNTHRRCRVRDGMFRRTDLEPFFIEAPEPTDESPPHESGS